MKVNLIITPVTGERVVSVNPIMEAYPEENWRRRLNNFTGRALTHTALNAEQKWRSGRIAAAGQLKSPGVISGLEADIEHKSAQADAKIYISPGAALTAGGEMMTLTRPARILWQDVFVHEHFVHVDNHSAHHVENEKYAGKLPTLGERIEEGASSPRAAVLVLEPVYTEVNVSHDDQDPCELDPTDFAFENWQLVDASRLVLYTWPEDWLPLPAGVSVSDGTDSAGVQWRNRIAFNIFLKERDNDIQQLHPWEKCGVPIALLGLDAGWHPLFIDRNAVVRSGGKRRRIRSVVPDIGNRFLWQAQFQQFNEHLAELVTLAADGENVVEKAEGAFRYLPPVGILPKDFMEPRAGTQTFFPLNYHVEAIAIPHEQLDVAVRDSAPLLPFDVQTADRVQVLVPAPQVYYEPGLLKVEKIDVEFDETIRRFSTERDLWLGRRLEVRRKANAIYQAVKGDPLTYTTPDPDAVDSLELACPFEKAVIELGDAWRYLKGRAAPPAQWAEIAFDDSQWESGPTGIGYGQGQYETELDDMEGYYVAIFCRKAFMLDENELGNHYTLVVTTNGGFCVYLNGVQIKKNNLTDISFNSPAEFPRKRVPLELDLSDYKEKLTAGLNVIAIQVHNYDIDGRFFEFSPRLLTKTFVEDTGQEEYGTTVKSGDDGVPDIDDTFEPAYNVTALDALKTYLDTKTPLSELEVAELEAQGLEEFVDFLQRKVDIANDRIDFGFIRLQTDIYRVRQHVLGNVEATKLATSPILATIAQGDTAYATKRELTDFINALKDKPEEAPNPGSNPSDPVNPSGGSGAPVSLNPRGVTFLSGDIQDSIKTPSGASLTGSIGSISADSGVLGKTAARPISSSSKVVLSQEAKGIGNLFSTGTPGKDDVREQTPIVGAAETFRHATVAERLEEPIATGAKAAGVATKASIIEEISNVGITVDDIEVPGFRKDDGTETSISFKDIKDQGLVSAILSGDHDKNKVGVDGVALEDESAYFNAGVRALENTSVVLRKIEGRVHAYKRAIARSKETLSELKDYLSKTDGRLKTIADELAEARHDVTVARALKAEEQARIDAINERRDNIIAEHVPFLVFRRPRLTETRIDAPVHTLNPDLSEAPVPVCDADEAEAPQEISAIMDVLREAPLKWFVIAKKILKRLNRLVDIRVTLKSAKFRVKAKSTRHPLLDINYESLNLLGQGIGKALFASQQLVRTQRKKTAAIDLAAYNRLGWNETITRANDVLSLGDVIDGNHGRMGASRAAAEELDQIARFATCLYLHFGQVLPSIRLDWAERLSQFDTPLNLRNLYSLPRWGELEYIERQEIQMLVDWLYQRVDAIQSEAVSVISDLIRICILLASHAPVNKIIAGQISEPTTVRVGSKIGIAADLTRVRIGQNVMVQSAGKTVARATIEDIAAGQVSARVLTTITQTVSLEQNTKVQIGEPRSIGGNQINNPQLGLLSMTRMTALRS